MFARRILRSSLAIFAVVTTLACASRIPAVVTPVTTARPTVALAAAPDQFFMSGDARIRYRDIGEGQPVVLIHGLGRSLDDWAGVGDSLARDHHVIALDLRGFGRSTRNPDAAPLGREMGNDVVRLLDHLGIRRAHLAGHSMGALVSTDIAARYRDRVSSVTLIAGPFYEQPGVFAKDEAGFIADLQRGAGIAGLVKWLFPALPDSTIAGINTEAMRVNDAATMIAAMRAMDGLMIYPSGGELRVPMLIAVGTRDPLLPQSQWLASWSKNARLVVLPDVDHFAILYHPETLAAMRTTMR